MLAFSGVLRMNTIGRMKGSGFFVDNLFVDPENSWVMTLPVVSHGC